MTSFVMKRSDHIHADILKKNHKIKIKIMKQPHGRMSTKWAPPIMGGGGIQCDGGITGVSPLPNLYNL